MSKADPHHPPHPPHTYEPFEPGYGQAVMNELFKPFLGSYFRPVLIGGDRIPEKGPLILAPNHSGNAFPYDGMVLDGLLWERSGERPEAKFRSVFEKELAVTWWMRPFGIDNFWRRGGGIDLTFDNFDRLLARGERIIYYPEGVPGIGKGFFRRYQLQRFSTSYVIMAARHEAPVYPIYIINAEWVIPFCFTAPPVDKLVQKLLHVPFLPLPAAPLGILFPFLWYLALPARMVFVVGEPIDMRERLAAAGETDFQNPDRTRARHVANAVRDDCQNELDRYVERYGRWPYQARSFLRELRKAGRHWWKMLPLGWPWIFVRHERNRRRPRAKNWLHNLLRDWDLTFFYLPLGWPLLTLARRFRKPPHGFRGLTRKERNEIEGNFHWHLEKRPLPPREKDPALQPDTQGA
ncbi:MAG TPA: 1-acyl-sn-glycerol-3-phosphate acyltransferase [Thermoanaerobaculia bacterium]|nr:1-acyl-sn-glycerol-3-phosphate acyltransferase [Thermoanaerobaculia bacterium]